MSFQITRREIFEALLYTSSTCNSWSSRYNKTSLIIKDILGIDDLDSAMKSKLMIQFSKIKKKWENCNRRKRLFMERNSNWLDAVITIISIPDQSFETHVQRNPGGRPRKEYGLCSERSKRRKGSEICNENETELLVYAAQKSLHLNGKHEEAKLMKKAMTSSGSNGVSQSLNSPKSIINIISYTPAEALALMIDTGLTKNSYQIIRTQANSRRANIYPSYKTVREAKLECYPPKESIHITEVIAEIELQALLDLTVRRIIHLQSEVLRTQNIFNNLHLVSKWGCDGSSGHSLYKQVFTASQQSDTDLFMTCVVPLQLYAIAESDGKRIILWQNPRSSSTRYCKLIKFEFVKETEAVIRMEKTNIDKQIKELIPSEVKIPELPCITVYHDLCMTMIDGKTCNAITNTNSAQKCNMCGATPVEMNNIDGILKRKIDKSVCEFGLSTLHAYIRFFEWLYHVSIRLDTKSWQKRKNVKDQINTREAYIKNRFHSEMGLRVGIIIQGKGTTHDGNTTRRFFENSVKSAHITGINEQIISR